MLTEEIQTNRQNLRRTIIRLAQKRQKPGAGSGRVFLRERTARILFPDLKSVLPVSWAVVGAAATRLYMPERMTQDFDIVLCTADGLAARNALRLAHFVYLGELSIGGSSWKSPTGFPIDVLENDAPWCKTAIADAQQNRDPQQNPVLPLAYLTLMKFEASRPQDIGDVTRMLGQASPEQLAEVRAVFARYLSEGDGEDLESLILLGQLELG